MRKLISILLLIAMLFSVQLYAAADEDDSSGFVEFDSTVTDSIGYTASEWFSSSLHRAAITTLLLLELASDENAPDIDASKLIVNGTYVGKADYNIHIFGTIDDSILCIGYCPVFEAGLLVYNRSSRRVIVCSHLGIYGIRLYQWIL